MTASIRWPSGRWLLALTIVAIMPARRGLAQGGTTSQDSARFAPPAPKYEFEVRKNVMVPMPDGVRLAADIYMPKGAGTRLPVVLIRLPYNKETYRLATTAAAFFAGHGYAVVVQDVRGKFQSEGSFTVQAADAEDGYHTIGWAATQGWSNGKVGTFGCSYLGEVQYVVSTRRHPNHAAMIAQSASGATGSAGGYYTDFGAYEGGAFTLSTQFGWFGAAGSKTKQDPALVVGSVSPLKAEQYPSLLRSLPLVDMAKKAGYPPTDFEDFIRHPPADPYWNQMDYVRDDDRFNTPALHMNSWLDPTPEQTLYVFNLMRRNGETARARNNQFVIMSPTVHCGFAFPSTARNTKVGDLTVGDARLPYWRLYLDWFDYWLKGLPTGVTTRPKVQYFVMHQGWRSAPTWPVPNAHSTRYYLTSDRGAGTSAGDGRLTLTKPAGRGEDSYLYDPENPFPSRGGTICCTGNPNDHPGIFDQADLESRSDLLVYSTPELVRGITVAGPVRLTLYVSSNARDTDFTAKLIDVDPQGRAWNVTNGILRARYRESMAKPVLMKPDSVYRIEVSLKSTAYRFGPGHRIRVHLTSSDFPMYDRNLNTGGDNVTETTWVKATNVVHHGGRYLSHLLLTIVP